MRHRASILPLLMILWGAVGVAQVPEYDDLVKNDPLLKILSQPRQIQLRDLLEDPEAYRGIPVELEVAFTRLGSLENPFFTRFTTSNYVNFACWGGEQLLWNKEEYLESFPLLFADRRQSVAETIATAKQFERYEVRAVVQDTFRGVPWIEIQAARPCTERLTRGAIRHVHQGLEQTAKGNHSLAAGEFAQALKAPLPHVQKLAVLKLAARTQEALENRWMANRYWNEAHRIAPRDPEVLKALNQIFRGGGETGGEVSTEPPPARKETIPPGEMPPEQPQVETPIVQPPVEEGTGTEAGKTGTEEKPKVEEPKTDPGDQGEKSGT